MTKTIDRPRERAGWRSGKPVEDPDKIKRWGLVTAKPSEFLVHVRNGRVTRRSGQGATCFKWPWDSVALIPTSLQRLYFQADQVSAEKVGVEVVGLAVYRIADPMLAYRVLNFSYPERAQEKLESTLTDMFIGATRRLIANLPVEDCLRKRKSALAVELMHEVAPVVGGEGRVEDTTDQGWGVVIDTIEIQEVRILSEAVFAAMQAPYRSALDRAAREARALAEKEVAAREAEYAQQIEEAKLGAEAAVRRHRAQQRIRAFELEMQEAQAALRAHEAKAEAQQREAEILRARAEVEHEIRRSAARASLVEGRAAAAVELHRAEAAVRKAAADSQLKMAENLPALAAAVGQRIGEVRISQIGSDSNPFALVAGAVESLVDAVRPKAS